MQRWPRCSRPASSLRRSSRRTCRCLGISTSATDLKERVTLPAGTDEATDVTFYGPQGEKVSGGAFKEGEWYIAQWNVQAGENAQTIEISASSFPGTLAA